MIDVSVIVPFRDAAATLARCLAALRAQESPAGGFEVIAVDNGSRDASAAVAQRAEVLVLREPRPGAYAARNRGVREARGRLLAFTDADCVPRPDWLRRLVDAMADPRIVVVMGRDLAVGRSRVVRLLAEYTHQKEVVVSAGTDVRAYSGHTNNLMTRREAFDRLGPFDERPRGADVLFVRRVLAFHGAAAVCYVPGAVVDHLELDSVGAFLRKAFVYGRSARRYANLAPPPALTNRKRLEILRRTVADARFPAADACVLFCALALGVAAYDLGWGSVRPRRALAPADAATDPEAGR